MKKGIFGQLFGFTAAIFLVSFFSLAALMYGFLGNYVASQQESELKESAGPVSDLTLFYMENRDVVSEQILKRSLDAFSANSGAFIIVLDAGGSVIATTGDRTDIHVSEDLYASVLSGGSVRYLGTLGGLFNTTMLTVGVPIRYGSSVVGATFLSVAVPEINRIRYEVFRIFLFAVGAVLLVALVIAYVISRRITTPIKELTKAAKSIASGDFNRRVSVRATNEIGELAATFNEMAESLAQLENMRSSFISNVSHELRTPMTTITGFVEGIQDGTIPPERQGQYLAIVLDESRRLSRLVSDLLDLTRMEQGRLKIERQTFDVNEQLRLQIIKVERRINDKNIDISVEFENDVQYVYADRDSILRVLTNLIDNAIKFTPEGGSIALRSWMENKKVCVSIANSGEGIAPEDLKRVFDRFYKTDKSRSLDKNGVGLGLYIVKSILAAHGETVWVTSEPDRETRFTFTLAPGDRIPERGRDK